MTIIQVGADYETFIEASSLSCSPQRIDRWKGEKREPSFCACMRQRGSQVRGEDVDTGGSARGLKLCVVQSAATMHPLSLCTRPHILPPMRHCRDVITRSIPH